MANKLDPMDLKQILTLNLDGYSNRNIGSALSISRNTVNTYRRIFATLCNQTFHSLSELNSAIRIKLDAHHQLNFQTAQDV